MVNGTTTARELTPTTLELDSSKGKNNSNFLALISHRLHSGPMAFSESRRYHLSREDFQACQGMESEYKFVHCLYPPCIILGDI